MRVLLAIWCSLALLVAFSPMTALAHASGTCLDLTAPNYNFAGQELTEGSHQIWGAEAALANTGANYFALCIGQGDVASASAVWPAMVGPGLNDIFQVGKVRCGHGYPLPLCDGTVHDVWAIGTTAGSGACTQNQVPTAHDLGASISSSKFYQLWRDSNGFGNFTAGNGANGAIAPSLLCWWNTSSVTADYFCETHDRGDECGGLSTAKERFNHIRYRYSATGTWQNAGGSQTLCNLGTTYSVYHCGYVDNQTFDTWSDSR
jgi:hypothetical protein